MFTHGFMCKRPMFYMHTILGNTYFYVTYRSLYGMKAIQTGMLCRPTITQVKVEKKKGLQLHPPQIFVS